MYFGVFRSNDNGASWILCNNGLAKSTVHKFAFKGNTIFAGTSDKGVFVSLDNGANWIPANAGLENANISDLVVVGTKIYVVSYNPSGVFTSGDDGASWVNIGNAGNGLTSSQIGTVVVTSEAIFAGTMSGVYRTLDNSVSWEPVNNGFQPNTFIYSLAYHNGKLFAGAGIITPGAHGGPSYVGAGGYCSTDKGLNWTRVNIGPTYNSINAFVFSGSNYFVSSDRGVYFSSDKGITWTAVGTGLPFTENHNLICSDENLFVVSLDGTLWRRPLSDFQMATTDTSKSIPTGFVLEQNYPNPFNPSTTISFSLPAKSFVTLKIYDVMGREVASRASEDMPAGRYVKQWNASAMPSGMYFYRLQAGNYMETKRMELIH